ncbi:MAG: prepilin-type N-terminal cleavage/methylation domain-containing protein [Gemmataceae bacterium]
MSKTLRSRPGFTLIELLVVIAIIATLVALTAAAVMAVRGKGPAITTGSDINQMNAACNQFQGKHGVCPPSSVVLSNNQTHMINDAATVAFFTSAWPRIEFSQVATSLDSLGVKSPMVLQGDQCLVLFLGGPPNSTGTGTVGWSDNPRNPFDTTSVNRNRWFEFQSGRLGKRDASMPFLSYKDGWGNFYAYFAAGKRPNSYVDTHCAALSTAPYFETPAATTPRIYVNPRSCQIISAGKDGRFGTGGQINLAAPTVTGNGADDLTNFTGGVLSSGQGS